MKFYYNPSQEQAHHLRGLAPGSSPQSAQGKRSNGIYSLLMLNLLRIQANNSVHGLKE